MSAVADDNTLRLTRIFDASRERLFDAWTDQKQFAEWFGPPGVTTVYCDIDAGRAAPGACWGAIRNETSPSRASTSRSSGPSAWSSLLPGMTRATTPSRASTRRR